MSGQTTRLTVARGLCRRAQSHDCAWSLACWKNSEDARGDEPEAWGDHGGLGATVRALAVLGMTRSHQEELKHRDKCLDKCAQTEVLGIILFAVNAQGNQLQSH